MCVYRIPLYYVQRLLPPILPSPPSPPSQLAVIAGTVSAALGDHFSSIKSCAAEGVLSNSARAPLLPIYTYIYIYNVPPPHHHTPCRLLLTRQQMLLSRMKLYIRGVVGCMYTFVCVYVFHII